MIDRYEIERKLARVLSRDLRGELDKLLNYLGDPPNLANVPAEYWQGGWKDIQKDVEPILVDTYIEAAMDLADGIGIGIDFDNVNRAAVNWARQHSEEVMQQIWLRTHEYTLDVLSRYSGVGEVIAQGYEEGLTIREISERLERMFSPVRAERIAVTETTRAVVEGERAYVAELERETGQRMIPIWMTANDELVCPICAPKNEKPITNGDYPPAHPNCRCGVGWEFPKDGAL